MPQRLPNHPFRLHTAPLLTDGYLVVKLGGTEALSKPYAFDITVLQDGPRSLTDLPQVGEHATLTLADSDLEDTPPRQIHGVLSRVKLLGIAYDRDGTWVEMQLVPRLALLEHTRTKRIFQDQTAQQIVDAILADHDVPRRWLLDATLPVMAFEVQYDETDLAFVSRLLARFGLFYFFEHSQNQIDGGDATETIVFCDRAMHYPPVARGGSTEPLALKLSDREGTFRFTESLMSFVYERQAKPTAVRHADRDMRTPGIIRDFGSSTDTEPPLHADRLVMDEFHERNANDRIRIAQADTRVELEQYRSEAAIGHGISDCHLFAPGHRFVLDNHEYAPLNAEWVLTSIKHEGEVPEFTRRVTGKALADPPLYVNEYHCTHASLPVRPARPPTVLRQVLETATVVGPDGEEIYVDLFGRIKVQFPWDREGQHNERSSCWVRVMQPMAGPGWGFQFIPRIGMEVAVSFIAGDTNHPVVSGCFYNAVNAPTQIVPNLKSRSGIRTQSTPGGAGYNELMFEDAAGEEQIYVHAQRDLRERVLRDHESHVDGNRSSTVVGSRVLAVNGTQTTIIDGAHAITVGGDEHAVVGGDRHLEVSGTAETFITGENEVRVGGGASFAVARDLATTVTGNQTTTVGADSAERLSSLYAWGEVRIDASKTLHLAAEERLVISCGDSSITLTPNGVEIDASKIILRGSDSVSLYGNGPVVHLTDKAQIISDEIKLWGSGSSLSIGSDAKMFGSGSSLHLDADAKLGGGSVKLGPAEQADQKPSESSDSSDHPPTRSLQLTVNDAAGQPIASKPYVLLVLGTKYSGTTDGSGGVTQQVPPEATVGLLTVTVAEGQRIQWHLDIATVEAATDVKGAQKRLRNLGYYHGPIDGQLSPSLERSLRRFQRENDITPATGALDSATSSKLSDVHGS